MGVGEDGAGRGGEPTIPEVRPVDGESAAEARRRWDALAKPPGSLGRLEDLGVQMAAIARCCPAPIPAPATLIVCAGDHGIVARGASAWPSEVTAAMVGMIAGGRAAADALAGVAGCEVRVLDVGVASDLPDAPALVHARVRAGTGDIGRGPAMSEAEALRAIAAGADAARTAVMAGARVLLCGDMGIGNTTAAAYLIAAMTGAEPVAVTGTGAGGVPVVLDGVNTVAAALVAVAERPAAAGYMVASHRSTEPGAGVGLEQLGLTALLELEMRLGEGTGALLALPLLRAAAAAHAQMALLDEVAGPG